MSVASLRTCILVLLAVCIRSTAAECAFDCASQCVKCLSRRLEADRQIVAVDVAGCKGDTVGWICARNAATTMLSCLGDAGPVGGGGGGGQCSNALGASYALPLSQTELQLQLQDSQQTGDTRCGASGAACCGSDGSAGACGASGVCGYTIDLSACPEEASASAATSTTAPSASARPVGGCRATDTTDAAVTTVDVAGHVVFSAAARLLSEGMPAWNVGSFGTVLWGVAPLAARGNTTAFFPLQRSVIAPGWRLEAACPANCANLPCEVIVAHYHCVACTRVPQHGNLPAALTPRRGWVPGACVPRFSLAPGATGDISGVNADDRHPMTGYAKVVAAGTTQTIAVDGIPLANVAVFIRQGVDCTDETDCAGGKPNWCAVTRREAACTAPCAPVGLDV